MSKRTLQIYADGACIGNPGPGGWAVLLVWGEHRKTLTGSESDTTNNRMELMAVIEGLKAVRRREVQIEIFTDSRYVRDGITKWIGRWKAIGWKTSNNKEVKNKDLWTQLDQIRNGLNVRFNWIPGHSGIPQNEEVDKLSKEVAYAHKRA